MLTVRDALKYAVDHALRGALSPHTPEIDVVNRALLEFSNAYSWSMFEKLTAVLPGRVSIDLTGAAYTAASKQLALTEAFDDYTYVPGDYVIVTASSTGVLGQFYIASRFDDDAIVLTEDSAAAMNAGATGITCSLDTARVAAPLNYSETIRFEDSNSLTGRVLMVSAAELLTYRTQEIPRSHYATWVAYTYAQADTGKEPVPIFEIWPNPTTNTPDRYVLAYRGQHRTVTDGNDIIELPAYAQGAFLDMLTAVAKGYDNKPGAMSMGVLIAQVLAGPSFKSAIRRDGAGSRHRGVIKNTAYRKGGQQVSFSEALLRDSDIITPG